MRVGAPDAGQDGSSAEITVAVALPSVPVCAPAEKSSGLSRPRHEHLSAMPAFVQCRHARPQHMRLEAREAPAESVCEQ